ncbi:MAG TPA: hypothetical protein VLX61_07605 [Anaerolineales bacterium]|nr:hypothetical protein [Anaerolineales bacterium]
MTFLSILIFLPSILAGILIVHLLWRERGWKAVWVKIFLGIGLGLGQASLLDFVYMLWFSNENGFFLVQLALSAGLLIAVVVCERKDLRFTLPRVRFSRLQIFLLASLLIVMVLCALSAVNIWAREPHGAWDAWMMYNRAARFIYRDQPGWLGSFSRQMDPIFHADYPLQLGMDIAWAWQAVGQETQRVPIVLSGLFMLACAGLLGAALNLTKSLGQASVSLLFLLGSSLIGNEGASQRADLPLAYFFISTIVLIYLFASLRKPGLLILAGFMAGLAAWTKNEGSLFVLVALVALFIAFIDQNPWRVLGWYLLGLVFPLIIVLYFKEFLAPPSDVLGNGFTRSIQQALDLSRHILILKSFGADILSFGGEGFGIIPILLAYALIFRLSPSSYLRPAYLAIGLILILQAIGYYGIYLITPYDLEWHLVFSLGRLVFQLYIPFLFLFFTIVTDVEKALAVK